MFCFILILELTINDPSLKGSRYVGRWATDATRDEVVGVVTTSNLK